MEASSLVPPAGLATRRPGSGMLLRLRSDEQLVTLFRRGDEDAFRVIHDRYRQRLSAYARQMLGGSAADAEDAMQDVFLRAYAALRADDRPLTLRAWLYRVAHNRCVDHLRRPASQATVELTEVARQLESGAPDPLHALEQREDLRRLVADVRALPDQQRSALLMREMEGLTYHELAAALGLTMPAVKSVLVRARMGLVEAQQARDTPCTAIRADIASSHDRGVRASGRARRHMRECSSCAGYRTTLRGISDALHALSPATGPWGFLAKLVGLGAGGTSAAGGAAAAGSGAGAVGATGTLTVGGTAATVGTTAAVTKIAAVVCCAAVLGGGVEVARESAGDEASAPAASAPGRAPSTASRSAGRAGGLVPANVRAAVGPVGSGRRAEPTRDATTGPPTGTNPGADAGPGHTDSSLAPTPGATASVLPGGGVEAPTGLDPAAAGAYPATTVDTPGPPLRLPPRPAGSSSVGATGSSTTAAGSPSGAQSTTAGTSGSSDGPSAGAASTTTGRHGHPGGATAPAPDGAS